MHFNFKVSLRFALLQFLFVNSSHCFAQQPIKTAHEAKHNSFLKGTEKYDKVLPHEPYGYKYTILLDVKTTTSSGQEAPKIAGPVIDGSIVSRIDEVATNARGDVAYIAGCTDGKPCVIKNNVLVAKATSPAYESRFSHLRLLQNGDVVYGEGSKLYINHQMINGNVATTDNDFVVDEAGNVYAIPGFSAEVVCNGKPIDAFRSSNTIDGCRIYQFLGLALNEAGKLFVMADYTQKDNTGKTLTDESGRPIEGTGIFTVANGLPSLVEDLSKITASVVPKSLSRGPILLAVSGGEPLIFLDGGLEGSALVLGTKPIFAGYPRPNHATEAKYAYIGNISYASPQHISAVMTEALWRDSESSFANDYIHDLNRVVASPTSIMRWLYPQYVAGPGPADVNYQVAPSLDHILARQNGNVLFLANFYHLPTTEATHKFGKGGRFTSLEIVSVTRQVLVLATPTDVPTTAPDDIPFSTVLSDKFLGEAKP